MTQKVETRDTPRYSSSSGKARPPYKTDSGAKEIGRLKMETSTPSGPDGPRSKPGARFTLEEGNQANWCNPEKGAVE